MKYVVRTLTLLALAVVIAAPTLAAAPKGKKAAKPHDPAAGLLKRLEKAELTADQIAKVKEIAAKYAEQLAAANKKVNLSDEQKKAQKEASEKAKADGLKGKDAQAAVEAAMKLTDEQKAARKEVMELQGAMQKEAMALLSDEQKAKAGIKAPGKKGRKQ